jgi:homoserine O-succinyltransferase
MVMAGAAADRQDIRPLRIGLLNLMPKKIQTETQFARLIGATPLQIELSLIRMTEHETKNTAAAHMEAFYRPFAEVAETGEKFDGLIITGAPDRTSALRGRHLLGRADPVFDWTQTHVHSTFGVCWGGMAMIHHFHGVKKHMLTPRPSAASGTATSRRPRPYLRGFSDDCVIPSAAGPRCGSDEIEAAGLPTSCSIPTRSAPAWSRTRRTARSTSSTISNTTAAR